MATLTRLRWVVVKPSSGYRGLADIINRACAPALDQLRQDQLIESAYVAKHGTEVWFTVFADLTLDVRCISVVEPLLHPFLFRAEHTADPTQEEMLQAKCDGFRACLDLMTRIALDVHRSPDLEQGQKELIVIGCASRLDRARLTSFLEKYSQTFVGIADRDQFWSRIGCNCLRDPTDCIHWLYNIVLGYDWQWSVPPSAIATQLGLSWP